jgi:hypothetical protein
MWDILLPLFVGVNVYLVLDGLGKLTMWAATKTAHGVALRLRFWLRFHEAQLEQHMKDNTEKPFGDRTLADIKMAYMIKAAQTDPIIRFYARRLGEVLADAKRLVASEENKS